MKKMIFSFLFAIVLVALIVPGAGHAQSTDT